MADDILVLRPERAPILPHQPVEDVVEVLRDLLARAERGDLTGIIYGTINANGEQGTGWTGGSGTRHSLSSCLMMVSHRYTSALLEGATYKDGQA